MNKKLSVRQATIQDLEGIAHLFNQYRLFYKQKSDLEAARKFILERFLHHESIIFVVAEKDKLIGFTQLYPSFSSVSLKRLWILNDLYVEEEYRKQGIAQLLLDAAKEYALLTQAKGIVLSTAIDNIQAQSLYERNGYKREETFYEYYLTL